MDNLRLYLVTYNVGTSSPDQDLKELLSITDHKNDKRPDFFILAFQEVKAQPQNMLMDTLFDDPWTFAIKDLLHKDYIKLKACRLQGLLLLTFCLKKHLLNIREMDTEYTRTGLAGMWGNKGAVSIRLNLYGCSICIVNSHLSAHDNHLDDRVEDYNSIINDQEFHVPETSKIFYHDYVFWMGDLNFRLNEEFDRTPEEIERLIVKKEIKALFEHDQLRHVMKKGEAFSELTEQDPTFPPTFKFTVGTPTYDYKRRPAWCDRILYRVNSNNYENITLKAEQLTYKSHPNYSLSDHKPVSAEFIIKIPQPVSKMPKVQIDSQPCVDQVFSDYSESVIEFDKITSWDVEGENKAYYRLTKGIQENSEDWIGLFKENFCALDEYVTYEYVSKCSTPTDDSSKSGSSKTQDTKKYEITFPDLPNRFKGNYCLLYFSQNEDKVTSVLGISNVFPIVKADSD
ncbi:inositol polyphosphate 5-phosphatase K-like isoform X1 [Diorhabda carinulata]|uniref:inositol polyphosphate 5-phosphatase K-like isoform X1 n=1 Tax=Diorhabda carinulata TaxID=1163345 RepID=UPI0025A09E1F|nr:inositol polyphosphate 5-phosphatase K-like isoform X1 [Diorhabda carinulata]